MRAYGIEWLARLLTKPAPISSSSVVFAFRLLLNHERLHFLAELAASRIEVAFRQPSYTLYFGDHSAASHEEALANAYAFSSSKRGVSAALTQVAYSWMSSQGPGYRNFHQWLGHHLPVGKRNAAEYMPHQPRSAPPKGSMAVRGKRALATRMRRSHASRGHASVPTGPSEFLFQAASRLYPPTYLVVDAAVPWLRVVRPFPKLFGLQVLVHTNDHKPPHIHIRVLQRKQKTRYVWPTLRPLPGDRVLSRSDEKSLLKYVQRYGEEIDAKVKSVPWT